MGVFELMILWLGGFLLMIPVNPFTFSRRFVRPPLRGGFSLSVCLSALMDGRLTSYLSPPGGSAALSVTLHPRT